jgi:hypothetical protein
LAFGRVLLCNSAVAAAAGIGLPYSSLERTYCPADALDNLRQRSVMTDSDDATIVRAVIGLALEATQRHHR